MVTRRPWRPPHNGVPENPYPHDSGSARRHRTPALARPLVRRAEFQEGESGPTAAGRVYATYGGVYIGVAILWLWAVDGIRPTVWDWTGVAVCLIGMSIIIIGLRPD